MNSEEIFRLYHLLNLRKMLAENSYPTLRRMVEEALTEMEEAAKGEPKLHGNPEPGKPDEDVPAENGKRRI